MIALHLSFIDGIPCLWGEKGGGNTSLGKKKTLNPMSYPFDPGLRELRSAIALLSPGISVTAKNTDLCYAWLPSADGMPAASSPILRELPPPSSEIAIAPWLVNVRKLHEVEALQVMMAMRDDAFSGTGILPGDSLLWCRDAFMPMLRMATTGNFLPDMQMTDTGARARWLPAPDAGIAQTCAALASSMPAVCRCVNSSSRSAPDVPADFVLKQMLENSLDAFIRMSEPAADTSGRRKKIKPESLHDAWLDALSSEDSVVHWQDHREMSAFSEQLSHWRRPVNLTSASPFTLCFRMSEPESEGSKAASGGWKVEYLLQLKSEPSMMAPVAELWSQKGAALREFERQGNTLEFILSALGQASGLDPSIARSLKTKQPSGFPLDTAGAVDFLRTRADILRSAGFGVILPSWWIGKGTEHGISLSVRAKSGPKVNNGPLSLDSLVDFDVEASLGGQIIDAAELRRLAKLKIPLVKVRGQWVLIDQKHLQTALSYIEAGRGSKLTGREIVRLALGADVPGLHIPIDRVGADGWLQGLMRVLQREDDAALLDPPARFTGRLRPYQQRGYSWLGFMRRWALGACLADDMGLGKTVQTLALIQREREEGEKRPVLLICPTTVVNTWRKEAEKFTPALSVHVHHGPDRARSAAFRKIVKKSAVVVTSYGLLHRDADALKDVDWAGIVLDEAQNIKNPDTKQARAARSLGAGYRLALTGTPIENHVGDLWSLMEFLNPGLLGSRKAFNSSFLLPIQIYRDEKSSLKLKAISAPFILRREKSDKTIISDLPEKLEIKTYCTLTREQATLYQAVLQELEANVEGSEGIERSGLVLALLTKLKQVCNHPAHLLRDGSALEGRSGKLSRLKEMLTEVQGAGDRALVFTQYSEMGGMLQRYLQEQFCEEVFFLHGGVSRKQRAKLVDRFQNDERAPHVFILSLKAGGTGLTLTRANHVFHFDRWWNPAVENQATDRVFRIGQKHNVSVYKYIVAGTLEERIDELIERKSGIAAAIVGTGEKWLAKLSNDELRDLVRLTEDAMGD